MTESAEMMGRWIKLKMRCNFCGATRNMGYAVDTPEFAGHFCSKFCALAAYDKSKEFRGGKKDE